MKLFDKAVEDEKLNPKWEQLNGLYGEKQVVEEWMQGFKDRDNKIVKEFQSSFHSAFWEFYLFAVMKELNLSVDFSHDRPDFIVSAPCPFIVEATVAQIKATGRKEDERNFEDCAKAEQLQLREDFDDIITEAVIRNSNAIHGKLKKYIEDYSVLPWVNEDNPYVIALGSYDQVSYGYEFAFSMLQLLYGYKLDPLTFEAKKIEKLVKPESGAEILVDLFEKEKFKHVSAVIFSCTVTLGKLSALAFSQGKLTMQRVINVRHDNDIPHFGYQSVSPQDPEELTDGLFVFHNPNANSPLSKDVFDGGHICQYWLEDNGLRWSANATALFARFNRPLFMIEQTKENVIKSLIEINKKSV